MYYPQQRDVPAYWTCYLVLQNSIQILFSPSLFQHVFSECTLYAQHSITVLLTQGSKSSHQGFLSRLLETPSELLASVAAVERQAAGLQFSLESKAVSYLDISFSHQQPFLLQKQDAGVPAHLLPREQLVVVISLREFIKTV